MAIEAETKTVSVQTVDRSWRVEIFCDAQLPVEQRMIRWHRSKASYESGTGLLHGAEQHDGMVQRQFSDLAQKSWTTTTGKTITAAEVMEVIAKAGDEERQIDIDRATA